MNGYSTTAFGMTAFRGGCGGRHEVAGLPGGSGGGGNAYPTPSSGATNTGSGGGGNKTGQPASTNVSGGSGVVILKVPDGNYSGTTTGSPTVTTVSSAEYGNAGNFKILRFNGDGSYTA